MESLHARSHEHGPRSAPVHVSEDAANGCHASPQQPEGDSAVLDALHQPVQRPPLPLCEVAPLCVPLRPCTHTDAPVSADCSMQM